MPYVGRFAPSPTGPLHFGSLVAALASWLDARGAGGRWLLRVEDLDQPRVRPAASETILRQLERLGLAWDGEVTYQSARLEHYREALARLAPHSYACACTRKELEDSALAVDGSRIDPGTCRDGLPPGRSPRAIRLRTRPEPIIFTDRAQGEVRCSLLTEQGDYVLLRADGLFAYQLAVVVDDAAQGVTDVVRGADLLDSTARQIHLQQLLGLATPRYLHVPVAVTPRGEKLSKQTRAAEITDADLAPALSFLGLSPPRDLAPGEILPWATKAWNADAVPRRRSIAVT